MQVESNWCWKLVMYACLFQETHLFHFIFNKYHYYMDSHDRVALEPLYHILNNRNN
jgi:hypothetical protein